MTMYIAYTLQKLSDFNNKNNNINQIIYIKAILLLQVHVFTRSVGHSIAA